MGSLPSPGEAGQWLLNGINALLVARGFPQVNLDFEALGFAIYAVIVIIILWFVLVIFSTLARSKLALVLLMVPLVALAAYFIGTAYHEFTRPDLLVTPEEARFVGVDSVSEFEQFFTAAQNVETRRERQERTRRLLCQDVAIIQNLAQLNLCVEQYVYALNELQGPSRYIHLPVYDPADIYLGHDVYTTYENLLEKAYLVRDHGWSQISVVGQPTDPVTGTVIITPTRDIGQLISALEVIGPTVREVVVLQLGLPVQKIYEQYEIRPCLTDLCEAFREYAYGQFAQMLMAEIARVELIEPITEEEKIAKARRLEQLAGELDVTIAKFLALQDQKAQRQKLQDLLNSGR